MFFYAFRTKGLVAFGLDAVIIGGFVVVLIAEELQGFDG